MIATRLLRSQFPRAFKILLPQAYLHIQPALLAKKLTTFEDAKAALNDLEDEPDNTTKLEIYGLFKQATEGSCVTPEPGMMEFVKKAKWDAWKKQGNLSKEEASKQYIDLIQKLLNEQ